MSTFQYHVVSCYTRSWQRGRHSQNRLSYTAGHRRTTLARRWSNLFLPGMWVKGIYLVTWTLLSRRGWFPHSTRTKDNTQHSWGDVGESRHSLFCNKSWRWGRDVYCWTFGGPRASNFNGCDQLGYIRPISVGLSDWCNKQHGPNGSVFNGKTKGSSLGWRVYVAFYALRSRNLSTSMIWILHCFVQYFHCV